MATRKTKKATPKQPAAKKKTTATLRQAAAKRRAGAKTKKKTTHTKKPARRPTTKKQAAGKTPARAGRTAGKPAALAGSDSRRRVATSRPAIEPGSLFDMSDEPSLTYEHGEIDEALAEPLRDLTGEQRVTKSLLGSLVEADEDERKRFSDPSRVVRVPDIEDDDSHEHKPNGRN